MAKRPLLLLHEAVNLFYEYLIAFPILVVITILAALTTVAGCALGSVNFWGYWPAHI